MALTPDEAKDLARAVRLLEKTGLAMRLASVAGKPLDGVMKLVPGARSAIHGALRTAVLRCLRVAIESQDEADFELDLWVPRALSGLMGGIGGLFGGVALPVELPMTMLVIMRAIADIARHQGEDLGTLEARLACLEVFALGEGKKDARGVLSYYAARTAVNRLARDVVAAFLENRLADASGPAVTRLATEITTRAGLLLTERAAAGAVPVIGAVGGATMNVMFTNHFTNLAEGHFIVRRLERTHGEEPVRDLYRIEAERSSRSN